MTNNMIPADSIRAALKTVTVIYYDPTCRVVVRERAYPSAASARRAIARYKGAVAIRSTRTADDQPTCHH